MCKEHDPQQPSLGFLSLFSKCIVLMLPEAEGPGVQEWSTQSRNREATIPAPRKLTVPGFHLEHEIFPLVSDKLHHWEYTSLDCVAGEDLTSYAHGCLGLTCPYIDIYWVFSLVLLICSDQFPHSYLTSKAIRPYFLVSSAVGS